MLFKGNYGPDLRGLSYDWLVEQGRVSDWGLEAI